MTFATNTPAIRAAKFAMRTFYEQVMDDGARIQRILEDDRLYQAFATAFMAEFAMTRIWGGFYGPARVDELLLFLVRLAKGVFGNTVFEMSRDFGGKVFETMEKIDLTSVSLDEMIHFHEMSSTTKPGEQAMMVQASRLFDVFLDDLMTTIPATEPKPTQKRTEAYERDVTAIVAERKLEQLYFSMVACFMKPIEKRKQHFREIVKGHMIQVLLKAYWRRPGGTQARDSVKFEPFKIIIENWDSIADSMAKRFDASSFLNVLKGFEVDETQRKLFKGIPERYSS